MRQFALVLILAAGASFAAEEKKEEKKANGSDGVWVVTSIEFGGMKLPQDELKKNPVSVTIKGNTYAVKMGDKVEHAGTSKVDLTKKPGEIDTTETEGASKGQMMKGIIEIKGDTMRICFDGTGKNRPKEFSTKDHPEYMLLEYKREKK